jgi:hypothetical protein
MKEKEWRGRVMIRRKEKKIKLEKRNEGKCCTMRRGRIRKEQIKLFSV